MMSSGDLIGSYLAFYLTFLAFNYNRGFLDQQKLIIWWKYILTYSDKCLPLFRMRLELQEARNEISKLRTDKKELEDKVVNQQKEFDRNIRNEQEKYQKLTREFKRTTEKMSRQYEEKKAHYNQVLDALNAERSGRKTSDEAIFL